MTTRNISITLLICIIHKLLSAAALESLNVKVLSPAVTMNAASATHGAVIGDINLSTTADLKGATTVRHQSVEKRSASLSETKDYDGRSAYINNQYIDDKTPTASYNDTSPPLYQFLQEQMEHILASSLPGEYQLQHNQANPETSADAAEKDTMIESYGVPATHSNTNNNSPVFGYGAENYEIADDTIQDSYAGVEEKEETYSKPETLELPKPIDIVTTTADDASSRAEPSNAANTTKEGIAADTELLSGSYGGAISPSQSKPVSQPHKSHTLVDSSYGSDFQNYKSHIMRQHSSTPSKYSYVHENSTLHMRKRRITFKTISSSSQIISTPLADLLFKFSIGMAKPSMAASANSLNEAEPLRDSISTDHKNSLNSAKIPQPSSLGLYGG